jgi:tetratricopeptide (TPR) repeat protein
LAALYEDQGRLEDARLVLERGRKNFDADENILYYLGFLYDRMGDKEKGFAVMEQLLRVNPNNANALNFVGYTLLERGVDLKAAAVYLEKAVALKPDDAFVLDSYGWLLYRQGKYQAAMKYLEKAYSIKPEEGVIAEHLADSYVALAMPKKALNLYQRALMASEDSEFKSRVEGKIENVRNAMAGLEQKQIRAQESRLPASR